MSEALARVRGLSVAYRDGARRVEALRDLDLELMAGERLAIIGESGSGKSTFARALAGLLPEGAVRSGAVDWPGLGRPPRAGGDIGFVFQDPGARLNPVLGIGEQVAEGAARHLGIGWKAARRQARDLLARVGLPQPDLAMRAFPHQLSGGQRQRVAIAAAIAARPRLLIADEPTSALDTVVQADIVALLDTLVREDGMTLLFITHDIALASGFADRVAVLHAARLAEAGPTATLLAHPQTEPTARLLAAHIGLATPPLVARAAA